MDIYNCNCVVLETVGRSRKHCRNLCVLSLPCSLLAFSSGSPTATSAPKVALDVIPRSKEEFLPKEQWADWALSLSSANSEE